MPWHCSYLHFRNMPYPSRASLLTANAEPNVTMRPIIVTKPTSAQLTSVVLQDRQVCYAKKVNTKSHQNIPTTISPITLNISASEKCDGAIRVSKLEKFDKVKHQIKLVCQSDRNAVGRER